MVVFLPTYSATDQYEGATLATDRNPCFSHYGVPKHVADLLKSDVYIFRCIKLVT